MIAQRKYLDEIGRRRLASGMRLLYGCLKILALPLCLAQIAAAQTDLQLHAGAETLRVQCVTDRIMHVTYSQAPIDRAPSSLIVLPQADSHGKSPCQTHGPRELRSDLLQVEVDAANALHFRTVEGREILAESPNGRSIEAAIVLGEHTQHVRQRWNPVAGESQYGLGQTQLGAVQIKGLDLDLWQHNTNVVVPFLVSSGGYGILWNNASYSRFGDLRPFEPIPARYLLNDQGHVGGLGVAAVDAKGIPFTTPDIRIDIPNGAGTHGLRILRFSGFIEAPVDGEYQLNAYSNGGIKVTFNHNVIMEHWRQSWLTSDDRARVTLKAGERYPILIETDAEQQSTMRFTWKTPSPDTSTSLWSEVGDAIDYYFVYGPNLDTVISGYRQLTGKATMPPAWSFGLWQSRQRYQTAQESLDVVKEFRTRQIPFDNIVQDWQYWRPDAWGSHAFDPTRFPDPEAWIKSIHSLHANLMISVWGKFNPNTENAKELAANGFLYTPNLKEGITDWIGNPYTFYDPFNPAARKLFWTQLDTQLFHKGIDAWWMDASEPDLLPSPPTIEAQKSHMNPNFAGTGARVFNAYALVNAESIYEGQRISSPNQRVFNLTRSGFAGQQRYSAVTWSGDITSTWTAMRKQIAAGLGFSISGVPYWTMDAGGYTMQKRFEQPSPADEEEWRELNVRWFQFATFCPFLRVHGELRPREMWTLGDKGSQAYGAELKYDKLRYSLFPYIYSIAGAITQHDQTMMRPLVMDFPGDRNVRDLPTDYMFGPAFLVTPVTTYKRRVQSVYLPAGSLWYSIADGIIQAGGSTVQAPAPYDQMPVFVRAGSIVPTGPAQQWIGQKKADLLNLHVYAGADADFTLYEDGGLTFDYEHGAYSEINFHWNDARKELRVSKRAGAYPGMLAQRKFQVQVIDARHPAGLESAITGKLISYVGKELSISFKNAQP